MDTYLRAWLLFVRWLVEVAQRACVPRGLPSRHLHRAGPQRRDRRPVQRGGAGLSAQALHRASPGLPRCLPRSRHHRAPPAGHRANAGPGWRSRLDRAPGAVPRCCRAELAGPLTNGAIGDRPADKSAARPPGRTQGGWPVRVTERVQRAVLCAKQEAGRPHARRHVRQAGRNVPFDPLCTTTS
jgi:hypothetical protein